MATEINIQNWLEKNLFRNTYRSLGKCGGGTKEEIRKLDMSKVTFKGDFRYVEVRDNPKPGFITLGLEAATNRSSVEQSHSFSYGRGHMTSVTTSTTRTIKLGAGLTIKAPLPKGWNAEGSTTIDVTLSESESKTQSVQEQWSVTLPTRIPPNRKVTCSFLLSQTEVEAVYAFKGRLEGEISFEAWCVAPNGEGVFTRERGPINLWARGMPLPEGMSLDNDVLSFDALGMFKGDKGLRMGYEWCECDPNTPDGKCCSAGKTFER
ncbi:MAG: ETX/MTX2 family pore-forming toxin [Enhygromyxa sp.]